MLALVRYLTQNSYYLQRDHKTYDLLSLKVLENEILVIGCLSLLICLTLMFIPPLLLLCYVQTKNFIYG